MSDTLPAPIKLPKATHEGTVTINGIELKSYNLDNGDRVLSRIGVLKAIGRTGKAKGGRKYDEEFKVPVFLTANNLKEFVSSELIENSAPVQFLDMRGNMSIGYRAQLLPNICYVFMDALEAGVLKANQLHIAEQCKLLVRGFATVGIIALVDEATGYQYDREKDELQKILKAYVSPEILQWQLTFHNNFYQEIFRLRKWDFTPGDIRKRPGVVGLYTIKYIYNMLPPNVYKTIKAKTPRSAAGNPTARYFQFLTPEIGYEHLKHQIITVNALMSVARNWSEFEDLFARRFGQRALDFDEKPEPPKEVPPKPANAFDAALKGLLNIPPPPKPEKRKKSKPLKDDEGEGESATELVPA